MGTQWQRWAVVAALAAGLVIGACGGGGDTGEGGSANTQAAGTEVPAGPEITVEGKEFSFKPSNLTLKAGQPVTLVLKNTGSIEHDLTISGAGFKVAAAKGQSEKKPLTMPTPGTYKMICTVSGHESAGMRGEIKVE
jgi:uncharacterized cupredoxin-like copper-binding protein